jgi:hypothetical protein
MPNGKFYRLFKIVFVCERLEGAKVSCSLFTIPCREFMRKKKIIHVGSL